MSLPVLVRSVGPEPSAGYYTQWTTFVPGYPKFKNQDTGVTSALYNGAAIEANLLSYRAHHLYFTGTPGEIVDRLVDIPLPLPDAGEYYDIPVTPAPVTGGIGGQPPVTYYPPAYTPPPVTYTPTPVVSQNTEQPTGPARLDITVSESFALSTGDAKVTPWMSPRYVQEREIQTNRWVNINGVVTGATPASVVLDDALSTQLIMQDFGFRIPDGARIEGFELELTRKVTAGGAESSLRAVAYAGYNPGIVAQSRDAYSWRHSVTTTQYQVYLFDSNGPVVIGAGGPSGSDTNLLYRSTDYGATFSSVNPGIPPGYDIRGIASGPNGVWIATVYGYGDAYKVIRSSDNGLTWSIIATPVTSLVAFPSTIATDGAGVWVFGETQGRIIYSVDDGLTWNQAGCVLG
jgi:hypothetical protein